MKADSVDACYNVGTGVKTSIKELAELLLELTGSHLAIQYKLAGITFVKNRIGSPLKAKNEITFEAKTSLCDGLQELIVWRNSHKEAVEKRRKAIGLANG